MKIDCLGIGLITLDVFHIVERFPTQNTKTQIKALHTQSGGSIPLALRTMKVLGDQCRLIGKIGTDPAGDQIVDDLSGHLDLSGLVRDSRIVTPSATVIVEQQSGERTIFIYRPTTVSIEIDDIRPSDLHSARLVHLDGRDRDAQLQVARWAVEAGIPVSIDIGSDRPVDPALLKLVSVAIVSETWATRYLIPQDPASSSEKLLEYERMQIAAVTCGTSGSFWSSNIDQFFQPAYPVDVVDSTGAGDVFHGAFLHSWLKHVSVRDSARFASAAAALQCTRMGGKQGIPSRGDIETFIHNPQRKPLPVSCQSV
jgi:sugar/nucleoside kinase (ribokinase family)